MEILITNQKKSTNKFDFPRRGFQNHLCSYFALIDLTKRHLKFKKITLKKLTDVLHPC